MAKVVAAGRATNAASGAAGVRRVGIGIDTSRFGHQVAFWRDDKLPAAPTLTVMESRDGYDRLAQQLRRLREKYPQAELLQDSLAEEGAWKQLLEQAYDDPS